MTSTIPTKPALARPEVTDGHCYACTVTECSKVQESDADFIAVKNECGENWLMCWTGTDGGGNQWNVTTDSMHGSDIPAELRTAQGTAELIAKLLNEYFGKAAV